MDRRIVPTARRQPKHERQRAGDQRDDERLHLQQREVAEDEVASRRRQVELADVGGCAEARREDELEVAFEIEELLRQPAFAQSP